MARRFHAHPERIHQPPRLVEVRSCASAALGGLLLRGTAISVLLFVITVTYGLERLPSSQRRGGATA